VRLRFAADAIHWSAIDVSVRYRPFASMRGGLDYEEGKR
jgi:hypothetical protein